MRIYCPFLCGLKKKKRADGRLPFTPNHLWVKQEAFGPWHHLPVLLGVHRPALLRFWQDPGEHFRGITKQIPPSLPLRAT